jgi:hypothetical protein
MTSSSPPRLCLLKVLSPLNTATWGTKLPACELLGTHPNHIQAIKERNPERVEEDIDNIYNQDTS